MCGYPHGESTSPPDHDGGTRKSVRTRGGEDASRVPRVQAVRCEDLDRDVDGARPREDVERLAATPRKARAGEGLREIERDTRVRGKGAADLIGRDDGARGAGARIEDDPANASLAPNRMASMTGCTIDEVDVPSGCIRAISASDVKTRRYCEPSSTGRHCDASSALRRIQATLSARTDAERDGVVRGAEGGVAQREGG